MTPFYGHNERPKRDVIPDWLLGGNRKRRVLEALAQPEDAHGWKPAELSERLGFGRTTVFEIVRALRPLKVIADDAGHVRIDDSTALGKALVELLPLLTEFADQPVSRPPRGSRRRT